MLLSEIKFLFSLHSKRTDFRVFKIIGFRRERVCKILKTTSFVFPPVFPSLLNIRIEIFLSIYVFTYDLRKKYSTTGFKHLAGK